MMLPIQKMDTLQNKKCFCKGCGCDPCDCGWGSDEIQETTVMNDPMGKPMKSKKQDQLISLIRKYLYEVRDHRNDGWVQGHYLSVLKEAKKLLEDSSI